MKILIKNKELIIPEKVDQTSMKITKMMLGSLRAKAESKKSISLYYAILIQLHRVTGAILDNIDADEVQLLMNTWGNDK